MQLSAYYRNVDAADPTACRERLSQYNSWSPAALVTELTRNPRAVFNRGVNVPARKRPAADDGGDGDERPNWDPDRQPDTCGEACDEDHTDPWRTMVAREKEGEMIYRQLRSEPIANSWTHNKYFHYMVHMDWNEVYTVKEQLRRER